MDKVQKICEELERLREQLQEKVETSDFIAGEVFIINYFLTFIDSLQKEPVNIWHDAVEATPTQGSNILMIRKNEEDSNYPPIAGCFHGKSYPYDKLHWGYYNGFCYNEIEPPVKWAYIDELLKLSEYDR